MRHSDYYIGVGEDSKGPYDLVMLVRKIRNGSLTEDMPIHLGNEAEAQAAIKWVELAEFFKEKAEPAEQTQQSEIIRIALFSALPSGWNFIQENAYATMFSSFIVLLIMAFASVIYLFLRVSLQAPADMCVFILSYAFLNCYMLTVLRMTRGQPIYFSYLIDRISLYFIKLLCASVLVTLPAAIGVGLMLASYSLFISIAGLIILIIPGLLWITLNAFTPLLIMDKGMSVKEAMQASRSCLLKSGIENIGNFYGLFAINFIAGLLFLLPLVLSLPITMSIVTTAYDDYFG